MGHSFHCVPDKVGPVGAFPDWKFILTKRVVTKAVRKDNPTCLYTGCSKATPKWYSQNPETPQTLESLYILISIVHFEKNKSIEEKLPTVNKDNKTITYNSYI